MLECPKCKSGEHTYNPWLPYNERLRDNIRWNELKTHGWHLLIFCLLFTPKVGIIVYIIFALIHSNIGDTPLIDNNIYPLPKIIYRKCSLGHKNCIDKARYEY